MKEFIVIVLMIVLMSVFTGCGNSSTETKEVSVELEEVVEAPTEPKEAPVEKPKKKSNDWRTVFSEKGFTEDEIASYEEILTNVGITDYHDVNIIENGRMHIIIGKIYDSKNLQVNITLEERKIILVELTGIPTEKTEAYINWRGKIAFKTVGTTKSVDLYYDMSGGYVAKVDWENNMILPYNE